MIRRNKTHKKGRSRRLAKRRTRLHRGGSLITGRYTVEAGKKPNEDTYSVLLSDTISVLCVFDGHGGPMCSKFLEAHLPNKIQARVIKSTKNEEIIGILKEEFSAADEVIKLQAWAEHMGATGTVCIVTETHIIVANIGDSPALLFTKEGKLLNSTVDHDCYNEDEVARILAAGGTISDDPGDVKRVNGELAVSRAFGDFSLKPHVISEPQIYIWPRVADAILAICSDGLTETQTADGIEHGITREQIAQIIAAKITTPSFSSLDGAARSIVEQQRDKFISSTGKYIGDNTSLIIALV